MVMYLGVPTPIDQVPREALEMMRFQIPADNTGARIGESIRRTIEDRLEDLMFHYLAGGADAEIGIQDTRVYITDITHRGPRRSVVIERELHRLGENIVPGQERLSVSRHGPDDMSPDQAGCWTALDHTDKDGRTHTDCMRIVTRLQGDTRQYDRGVNLAIDIVEAYNNRDKISAAPTLKRDWLENELDMLPNDNGYVKLEAVFALVRTKFAVQNQADTGYVCKTE